MSEEFEMLKAETMMEFPEELKWEYPDNMLWLKYWIFVNIRE